MERRSGKILGISMTALGLAVIVLAVLLFGLTTDSGAVDWVSIITAVAGVVLAATGLNQIFRGGGTSPRAGGPSPHPAS
jgi:hypothetical protein